MGFSVTKYSAAIGLRRQRNTRHVLGEHDVERDRGDVQGELDSVARLGLEVELGLHVTPTEALGSVVSARERHAARIARVVGGPAQIAGKLRRGIACTQIQARSA